MQPKIKARAVDCDAAVRVLAGRARRGGAGRGAVRAHPRPLLRRRRGQVLARTRRVGPTAPNYGGVMVWDRFADKKTGYSTAVRQGPGLVQLRWLHIELEYCCKVYMFF